MSDLKQALRRALATHFGVKGEIRDDTGLFSGGLIDSLSVMDLVSFVEGQIDRLVPPVDITLENFDSLDSIQRYAESLRCKEGPG